MGQLPIPRITFTRFPSPLLTSVRIDPLTSVRLVSAGYALVSTILFTAVVGMVLGSPTHRFSTLVPLRSLAFVVICIFVLLPSWTIWGTIGLRGSASEAFALSALAAANALIRLKLSRGL